jgi:hypothetical protein
MPSGSWRVRRFESDYMREVLARPSNTMPPDHSLPRPPWGDPRTQAGGALEAHLDPSE